ncbi:MAG: septum site-determining protein MinC [Succinivibrionaceae bacterium]
MTEATFKVENYVIHTLYLSDVKKEALIKVLNEKSVNENITSWIKIQPLVIDINNADNKAEIDYNELVKTAADLGFNIIGITPVNDGALHTKLLQSKVPVLQYKKLSNKDTTSTECKLSDNVTESDNTAPSQQDIIKNLDPSATLIHVGNVRSGSQLYARNKSLVVIGNVGDGAELCADDCVFVFGTLKGRVLAGGQNNKNSIIYCNNFEPQLISIAGVYQTIDDINEKFVGHKVLTKLNGTSFDFKLQD